MSKLKHYLPQKALLTVYYSLVHTHLLYGLSVWGSAYTTHLKKLITLQNKAVKIIGGGSYRDKASPCYSDTKILKLPYLYKLEIGKFVHAHFQNKIPQKISKFFTLTREETSLFVVPDLLNKLKPVYTSHVILLLGCKNVLRSYNLEPNSSRNTKRIFQII